VQNFTTFNIVLGTFVQHCTLKEIDYLSCILQFGAMSIELLAMNKTFNDNLHPIMGTLAMSAPEK
jgi:hypothetical protein